MLIHSSLSSLLVRIAPQFSSHLFIAAGGFPVDANFTQITQVVGHPLSCVLNLRKPSYSFLHRIEFSTLGGTISPGREMVGAVFAAGYHSQAGLFPSKGRSAHLSSCFLLLLMFEDHFTTPHGFESCLLPVLRGVAIFLWSVYLAHILNRVV